MFDEEKILNLKTRTRNLTPTTPFSSVKAVLDFLVDVMKQESLETSAAESDEERQARRIAINGAKENLLNALKDPEALWAEYQRKEREANQ
jgi:hypothetical protein